MRHNEIVLGDAPSTYLQLRVHSRRVVKSDHQRPLKIIRHAAELCTVRCRPSGPTPNDGYHPSSDLEERLNTMLARHLEKTID